MHVLILYKSFRLRERRTIRDHLYSFARYGEGCRFVYCDVPDSGRIPASIARHPFDAVILHYTYLAVRLDEARAPRFFGASIPQLRSMSGVKVLLPHDEYLWTKTIWEIVRGVDARLIYASCYPEDYAALYPVEQIGDRVRIRTVLTGYVDEGLQRAIDAMSVRRSIDIGYRALKSNYVFGFHGQLKTQVGERTREALRAYPKIVSDIRMTSDGYRNTITGNAWLKYLLRCRSVLGCLGGSSLMDADGSIRSRIRAYLWENPDATYAETEAHCYPGMDGKLSSRLLGPRHMEAAMTRTCQLLVEGDYHGVLLPGEDYIEIKADFSNLHEALALVEDGYTCEAVAARCFDHVVASGKYTYRAFAGGILADIRALQGDRPFADGDLARLRLQARALHLVNLAKAAVGNLLRALLKGLLRNRPEALEKLKAWRRGR